MELFAGVGGFRLGLERAGHEVVWANEWDKYAADVYDYNFGSFASRSERENESGSSGRTRDSQHSSGDTGRSATDYSEPGGNHHRIDRRDITTVPSNAIPDHDLICGGFPCQAFSVAGKRLGFEETRGTLFFEIARILRDKRTPYLFLENVKGLLNHDQGRTFETILRTLDELGYDCQWQVLNSKDFGVPQNRERVFIVGHLRTKPRPQVFPIRESDSTPFASTVNPRKPDGSQSYQQDRVYRTDGVIPAIGSQLSGRFNIQQINQKVRSEQLLNEVARQPLRFLGRNQKNIEGDYAFTVDGSQTSGIRVREATHQGYAIAEPGDSINLAQPNSTTRRGRVGKGVANMLETGVQQAVYTDRIRRLTPIECERLQAFPGNWTKYGLRPDGTEYEMSDTQRYKQMGNAITVNVVEAIAARLTG